MVAGENGFKVAIVGRDATSSALLSQVLTYNLGCTSTRARDSDLSRMVASGEIDLAIISADIGMNRGAGFGLAEEISKACPSLPIVILTDEPGHDATISAFRSGARGIFNNKTPTRQFLDCVKHVRKGYIWAAPEETEFLLRSLKSFQAESSPGESILKH